MKDIVELDVEWLDIEGLDNDGLVLPAVRVKQRWSVRNKSYSHPNLHDFGGNMKLLTEQLVLYCLELLVVYKISYAIQSTNFL